MTIAQVLDQAAAALAALDTARLGQLLYGVKRAQTLVWVQSEVGAAECGVFPDYHAKFIEPALLVAAENAVQAMIGAANAQIFDAAFAQQRAAK
jgi:hypothetical protein